MSHQIAIIGGAEILENITESMIGWLGPAAYYCNYLPLINSTLGWMLHGQVFHPTTEVSGMIQAYGIPTDAAEELAENIELYIENTLIQIVGEGLYDYNYAWDIKPNGDIYLTVMPQPVALSTNTEVSWLKSIRDGVSAGDWYPEHMRRLAGC